MVDAFPLPRHREKLCNAESQQSRKGSKLNGTPIRRRSITRSVLGDIQRAVEHLQLNMSNYDSSSTRGFTFSGAREMSTNYEIDYETRRGHR